jgi:hypothetical protein
MKKKPYKRGKYRESGRGKEISTTKKEEMTEEKPRFNSPGIEEIFQEIYQNKIFQKAKRLFDRIKDKIKCKLI